MIDYWLHHASRDCMFRNCLVVAGSQIGRYLDGEEEQEGTYR